MPTAKRLCRKCERLRPAGMFVGTRGKTCRPCRNTMSRAANRERHLADTYNLTSAEYAELLAAQDGGCAICGQSRRYLLHVDHDHARERTHGPRASVRGLLCKADNKLLGLARDNPERLEAAADYIRSPPAFRVLA